MPTILRFGPYRVFFYSNEGREPPHVHVWAGNREVKIWLHDLSIAVNYKFSQHELAGIIRELEWRREFLLEAWYDHFGD